MKKYVSILGSTGSIGLSSLKIFDNKKSLFSVNILAANKNYKIICHQINKFKPRVFIINDLKIQKNESKFVKKDLNVKVSYVKKLIDSFKNIYLDKGQIPHLNSEFDANLFKTFISYINHENYFPRLLNKTVDERGVFFETIRSSNKGQYSCSTTLPGQIRGNHFHTRKIERFIVIQGKALIKMRKIDSNQIIQFEVDGKEPVYVDMPLWFTHNIENVGDKDLITLFWINEFYNKLNTDTFFEKV